MAFIFGRKRRPDLQPLRPEFLAQCAMIHASAFASGWSENELDALISGRNVIADCATDGPDETIAGFIISRIALDEAEILTIVVGSKFRNQEIGRALVDHHLFNLNRAGVRSIFLEVAEDNVAALRLYRNQGFQPVGVRKAYYSGVDGVRKSALTMAYLMP